MIIQHRQLTQSLEHTDVEVNVEESDAQMEQYYQVRITDLYNNEQSCARKNRLGKYFEESEFRRLIFEEYAFSIFEDKVKFYINDDQIEKQEYIEEPPHTRDIPYIDVKGQIGEGIAYNSFGYFLTAEKQWSKDMRLSLITFGAPTRRGQSAALTQETFDIQGFADAVENLPMMAESTLLSRISPNILQKNL